MFTIFKKIFEKSDSISDESDYESYSYDESEDESSEVDYDEDVDILLPTFQDKSVNRFYSPFNNKLNDVLELKRQLCFFRDIPYGKKWYVLYALWKIEKIGIYPPGMPYTKPEFLNMVYRYHRALKEEGYDVSYCHKYLSGEDNSIKFELWAKTPIEENSIYSMGRDENGQTLLHHAVRWNNFDLVKKLLSLGFNINEEDNEGKTPIFGTVGKLHKNCSMAELLLTSGANPYHKCNNGKNLLDKAIQKGNLNLVILLVTKYNMEFGYRVNTFKSYPKWAQNNLISFWVK